MKLTKTNLQVLWAIYRYAKHYCAWPSLADIGKRLHRTAPAVAEHVTKLRKFGLTACHRAGPESGERITVTGYKFLKREPINILHKGPRRRTRNNTGLLGHDTRRRNLYKRLAAIDLYDGFPVI